MKNFEQEQQLVDEIVNRVKANADVLDLSKDHKAKSYLALIESLNKVPKAQVPVANFDRVRNQILDRIAIPKEEPVVAGFGSVLQALPRILRIGGGVIGGFLIVSSLAISTAVLALESVPGQTIYPVKKAVENVQLKLATTEAEKTNLQIKFANNRLEELEKVLEQNKQGKVSGEQVQRVVEDTVKDVSETTSAVAQTANEEDPQVHILSKIVDLSNKQTNLLQTASVQTEGDVKVEVDKALEASLISREQAIENIERAGLKVEEAPIVIDEEELSPDEVRAYGEITSISSRSVDIGSSTFTINGNTVWVNTTFEDLEVGMIVKIKGSISDNRTYALEIVAEVEEEPIVEDPNTTTNETETEPETIEIE